MMMTMDIKLPKDFRDKDAIQEYFRVTDSLAWRMIEFDGWLKVDEKRAMRIMSDPRFNGSAMRESGDVMDVSWHFKGPAIEEAA